MIIIITLFILVVLSMVGGGMYYHLFEQTRYNNPPSNKVKYVPNSKRTSRK